uniref:DEAD (Asp-Glu-Ala-Asp) box helicase 42 n=1 Tax=Neogobius melanostomus TaxID=47308 RepID=A0A8C6TS38_9GOBI
MNWSKGGPGVKRGFGFGGFALGGKKEEPRPPEKSVNTFGGSGSGGGYGKGQQMPSFFKIGTKRGNFDEENAYFEDDEEESSSNMDLPYIPAENSPTRQQMKSGGGSDSEDDPLDAFMAETIMSVYPLLSPARGLDIPSIRTVVNYDVARDIDTHTHRIGRTGRAGEKGVAYTLLTSKDTSFAGDLVRNLEGANQGVSKELMDLAMQNPWFRKSRFKGGKGRKLNIGGGGLGYRERPGLGAESSGSGNSSSSILSSCSFEGYSKPMTGAMGERVAAMKQAFQAQYKSHFVAASGNPPKLSTSSSSSSGWTSAGSLSSVPTESANGPKMSGFTSAGTLSTVPSVPPISQPSYPPPPQKDSSRDRYGDDRSRHGDSHHRHSDRGHSDDRYGSRDRHGDGERDRHGDRDRSSRHSESRHGDSRNGDGSRRERDDRRSDRDGDKDDGFAVPEPPKKRKSRWDN